MSCLKVPARRIYTMTSRIVPKISVGVGIGLTIIWASLLGYSVFSSIWSAI